MITIDGQNPRTHQAGLSAWPLVNFPRVIDCTKAVEPTPLTRRTHGFAHEYMHEHTGKHDKSFSESNAFDVCGTSGSCQDSCLMRCAARDGFLVDAPLELARETIT